jgi:hypothetical protein
MGEGTQPQLPSWTGGVAAAPAVGVVDRKRRSTLD